MVNLTVNKKIRRHIQYILIRAVLFVIQILPRQLAASAAAGLSGLAWHLLKKERKKTLFNLALIFPDRNDHELIGKKVFHQMALSAVDAVTLFRITDDQLNDLVTVEGLEHFDAAYKQGKGLVVVTGHIGCWEFIPAWFSRQGYKVSVIGKRVYDPRLDRLLVRLRSGQGVNIIDRDSGAKDALRDLRNGHAVGILIDQDTRVASIDVEFFGHTASTPMGAAALAEKTGAPVIPLAIFRQPDGKYLLSVKPAIAFDQTLNKEDRIKAMVQEQTRQLEEFIRRDITQWVWMHLRWKEKP